MEWGRKTGAASGLERSSSAANVTSVVELQQRLSSVGSEVCTPLAVRKEPRLP